MLKLLQANWPAVVAGLLLLALGLQLKITKDALDDTRNELAVTKTLRAQDAALIEQQNAGIAALQQKAAADKARYEAGLRAAEQRAAKIEAKVDRIMLIPSPPTKEEQCAQAEALLRKELSE